MICVAVVEVATMRPEKVRETGSRRGSFQSGHACGSVGARSSLNQGKLLLVMTMSFLRCGSPSSRGVYRPITTA